VRRSGRLLYRDRFRWDGPWGGDEIDWYFGGALAAGSLYVSGSTPEVWPAAPPGLRQAAFPLSSGGCCLRWCGDPALVTTQLVRFALLAAANRGPRWIERPWLLDSSSLAPNHWFSRPPVASVGGTSIDGEIAPPGDDPAVIRT
jgi:urease accessory protein